MTKLTIKEEISLGNPVTSIFPFEDIKAGDMFYCYNTDTLLMVVEDKNHYFLVDINCARLVEENNGEYFEDVFSRLTEEQGEWYPVIKAKLKFKVGE